MATGKNKQSSKPFSILKLNQKITSLYSLNEIPSTASEAASVVPPEPLILRTEDNEQYYPDTSGHVIRTNMVNTQNSGLIQVTQADIVNSLPYISVWDDEPRNLYNYTKEAEKFKLRTKDIDFGTPGVLKNIYKVYITFRLNALKSNVRVRYAVNGETNFDNSFSGDGEDKFVYDASWGFSTWREDSNTRQTEEWSTIALTPSNNQAKNIYSIALEFYGQNTNVISTDKLQESSSAGTNEITLGETASNSWSRYNGVPIHFFKGPGVGTSYKITEYNGTHRKATLETNLSTDVTTSTYYDVGYIPSSFEINDISIVYREKSIK